MLYDTASSWVSVGNLNTRNVELVSNYDIFESKNAHPVYLDISKTTPSKVKLDYGSFFVSGEEYTDNICLNQNRNDRRDDTGRLCVRNMPFVSINEIVGTLKAMGIVGLAPNNNEKSFINQLYEQGQVAQKIVGLNFEDPSDRQSVSTISFGYIDYSQI